MIRAVTSDGGLNILVIMGSVRRERLAPRLACFLTKALESRGERSTVLDPRHLQLPMLDKMYKEYQAEAAPQAMRDTASAIRAADAVIVVSAEYNHGIPPALVNLLDHFQEEWFHRPAGIACYSEGQFGGVRAAMQLRMTLPELGMPTISTLLAAPRLSQLVDKDGATKSDWFVNSSRQFLDELCWWARAARSEKGRTGVPFGEVLP